MGLVAVGENNCYPLPDDFQFDEPNKDKSLYYDDDFEIVYEPDPERTPFGEKTWRFPADTVLAWQFDYMKYLSGDKYFSLDSANTIGIYGCNDTTGLNIRSYKDTTQFKDAAQFKWNSTSQTFQKNGQWVEYSVEFNNDAPKQLLLGARNNVDANFKLSVTNLKGDTVFFRDINLKNDFTNLGGGYDQTDWFLSKFPVSNLWGTYTARFDWYDNIGEPGIFGAFSFITSTLDFTPPEWYYVSVGNIERGTDIVVMTTEAATVYLVPAGTPPDTTSILLSAVASVNVTAYAQGKIKTSELNEGDYVVYALDNAKNVSEASRLITLQIPVHAQSISSHSEIIVQYNPVYKSISIKSTNELNQIDVYNILGKKVGSATCDGKEYHFPANGFPSGVYLTRILYKEGNFDVVKLLIQSKN
jgi:hypothetical protein